MKEIITAWNSDWL